MAAEGGGEGDGGGGRREEAGASWIVPPDGNVLFGAVVDMSYSMKSALGLGTVATAYHSRAHDVFGVVQKLLRVCVEVSRVDGRSIKMFACAVGVRNMPRRECETCDLFSMIEGAKRLLYSAEFTVDDLIEFGAIIDDRVRRCERWIRNKVQPDEATDLMRFLLLHEGEAHKLVELIPEDGGEAAAMAYDGAAIGGGVGAGLIAVGGLMTMTGVGAVFGVPLMLAGGAGAAGGAGRLVVDAAVDRSEAVQMKNRFVEQQRRSDHPGPPRIKLVPEAMDVDGLERKLGIDSDIGIQRALCALIPHIYGRTPLAESLERCAATIERQGEDVAGKVVFIISDGAANDCRTFAETSTRLLAAAARLRDLGVVLVGCFLTSEEIGEPRQLFDAPQREWSFGEKLLFDCTTRDLHCDDMPVALLVHHGWKVPSSNRCQLFVRTNSVKVVQEFHTLVADAFVDGDARSTIPHLVRAVNWVDFIRGIPGAASASDQGRLGICWAHCCAGVTEVAMRRIHGREGGYPTFQHLRDIFLEAGGVKHIVDAIDAGEDVPQEVREDLGRSPFHVLQSRIREPDIRLDVRQVGEDAARQVLIRGRPLAATFWLSPTEWTRFGRLQGGADTESGILSLDDVTGGGEHLPVRAKDLGGHAVILVGVGPDYLEFLNSWGADWGKEGRFRIRNASVLREMKFYDVFWTLELLTESEKAAWEEYVRRETERVRSRYPSLAEVLDEISNEH